MAVNINKIFIHSKVEKSCDRYHSIYHSNFTTISVVTATL